MATAEKPPDGAQGVYAQAVRSCIPLSTGAVALRPLKMSETVARDVVHDIMSQDLRPGDRLPPEARMLETYGVSRESLREGLRLLEVQGLITIRRGPGGGPVVGSVDPANLGRASSLYYHLAGATYTELFEAWIVAESLLAERAARHEDREEVRQAMEPYVASPEHLSGDGLEAYVDAATRFHAVVAALGDNRVLELLLSTVGQIVTHHVVHVGDPRVEVGDTIGRDHEEIAQAIRAGHPRKARELMERHISGIAAYYSERMGPRVTHYIDWQ